jgi:DNA repair protein RecN (Recombination protein N)
MLTKLTIQNYALIRSLEITPHTGLNIITGETGAGKSIMLGAVGLLLGRRADSSVIFDPERKCVIEGTFQIETYGLKTVFEDFDVDYEAETIIRREVNSKGKSRAFVNDTPCTLEFLKQLGLRLMDVHSQHETLQLGAQQYQLALIDALASNQEVRQAYQVAYHQMIDKQKIYQELVEESDQLRKEADYHQFLFDELDQANFYEGEQEELEEEVSKLEHAEEIKTKLFNAIHLADQAEVNLTALLTELKSLINSISGFSKSYEALNERLASAQIELKDIIGEIELEEGQVEVNPQRLLECQERLSLLYKLQQKHQVSDIKALLVIHEELSDKVLKVSNLDDAIEAAKTDYADAQTKAQTLADQLSSTRTAVFEGFETQVIGLVAELGMPNAQLKITHQQIDMGPLGADEVDILFSANKGIAPAPIKSTASGGEFSRLMFAVKYVLAGKTALPTMIFDEIDAGISGEVAIQMAKMMAKMSANHQVITITHLPQIAAKGQHHYFVYKDDTAATAASKIRLLNEEDRLKELAQMIGGVNYSATALDSARELMG